MFPTYALRSLLSILELVEQRRQHENRIARVRRLKTVLPVSAVPVRPSGTAPRRPTSDDPLTSLARDVCAAMRRGETNKQMAAGFRERMVAIGVVRHDSTRATAIRRLQQFKSEHIVGKLMREDELPSAVRQGRATGGSAGR